MNAEENSAEGGENDNTTVLVPKKKVLIPLRGVAVFPFQRRQ